MQLMDLAKNMELEGKAYYLKLAAETPIKELKGIFTFLANEEDRHFYIFDLVSRNYKAPKLEETSVNTKVKEVFSVLSRSFTMPSAVYDYEDAYSKAFAMETESVKYYTELKNKSDKSLHPFIDFIIKQERGHAKLMEALIEFVSKPKQWLEDAEWNHLDIY